jgi:hypothetical protein
MLSVFGFWRCDNKHKKHIFIVPTRVFPRGLMSICVKDD